MDDPFSHDERIRADKWFSLYCDEVTSQICRRHPEIDRDMIVEAFTNGVLDVCRKPDSYDPQQGPIVPFLVGVTLNKLLDSKRSETSRKKREQKYGQKSVARKAAAAKSPIEVLIDSENADVAAHHIQDIRSRVVQSDEEGIFFDLYAADVSELVKYAKALNIEHRSDKEQKTHVKRIRDRVTQRIRRLKDEISGEYT